jgi:hypothetical protein
MKNNDIPPSIYIGGAGCGAAFFIGAIHAIKEKWGEDVHNKTMFCGDSVGSILALQLAIGYSSKDIELISRNIFRKMRTEPHFFYGNDYWLNKYIDYLMDKHNDLHITVKGKFKCGTTRFPFNHQWHDKWENNNELSLCLKASTNIPIYCSKCEKINDYEVIDGAYGFNGNHFPHGNETLFIGANQPSAEISHNITRSEMIYPDNHLIFNDLFKKGYDAFHKWDGIKKEKVKSRKTNYFALIVCWFCKGLQIFYQYTYDMVNENKT